MRGLIGTNEQIRAQLLDEGIYAIEWTQSVLYTDPITLVYWYDTESRRQPLEGRQGLPGLLISLMQRAIRQEDTTPTVYIWYLRLNLVYRNASVEESVVTGALRLAGIGLIDYTFFDTTGSDPRIDTVNVYAFEFKDTGVEVQPVVTDLLFDPAWLLERLGSDPELKNGAYWDAYTGTFLPKHSITGRARALMLRRGIRNLVHMATPETTIELPPEALERVCTFLNVAETSGFRSITCVVEFPNDDREFQPEDLAVYVQDFIVQSGRSQVQETLFGGYIRYTGIDYSVQNALFTRLLETGKPPLGTWTWDFTNDTITKL